MWKVYCLQNSTQKRTYIGATLNVDRRLNQHNGLQSGGAKATRGHTWSRVCFVEGFPNERAALQFEWAWKFYSKQQVGSSLAKRIKTLFVLLGMDKPTSKAIDYPTYQKALFVNWESEIDPMSMI